jgi:surfactin synthase thioesterase subunit
MGAVVAFEVARRLRASESISVLRLFASAGPAPSQRRSRGIHLRDDEGLVAYVRELGGGAELLEVEELRQIALPMVRSDVRLIETYRYVPGEPLSCPITAIAGAGDHFYLDDQADRLVPLIVERILPRR